MVYFGYFNSIQVCFELGNVFSEKKLIIVKGARNCSEESNNQIPLKIPLKNILLKAEDHKQITERFAAKDIKKKTAKGRKKQAEVI